MTPRMTSKMSVASNLKIGMNVLTQTLRNWQKNVVTNKQIRENAKKKPVKAGVKVKRKNVKNHNLIQSVSNAI